MRLAAAAVLAALAVLVQPAAVAAHTTSTGLATITVSGSTITYRLTVIPGELGEDAARLLPLAADGDAAAVERIASELRRRITIRSGDTACRPGRAVIQGSRLGDGRVTLELTLTCPSASARLTIRDDWADLFGEHGSKLPVTGFGE